MPGCCLWFGATLPGCAFSLVTLPSVRQVWQEKQAAKLDFRIGASVGTEDHGSQLKDLQ